MKALIALTVLAILGGARADQQEQAKDEGCAPCVRQSPVIPACPVDNNYNRVPQVPWPQYIPAPVYNESRCNPCHQPIVHPVQPIRPPHVIKPEPCPVPVKPCPEPVKPCPEPVKPCPEPVKPCPEKPCNDKPCSDKPCVPQPPQPPCREQVVLVKETQVQGVVVEQPLAVVEVVEEEVTVVEESESESEEAEKSGAAASKSVAVVGVAAAAVAFLML